jgi:hypothetical protein
MIKNTKDRGGNLYGYDEDENSQTLASQRIHSGGHVLCDAPTPAPQPSAEAAALAAFAAAIQARLDAFARTRNYDGILSACTYATSLVPKFKAEGQYCAEARDGTWVAAYGILAAVNAGTRPMPAGVADIEADLPALAWPA